MVTTINQAQEYLETYIRPSVFERAPEDSHLKDPLDRMRALLKILGNPEKKFKSVQVSGTSGKGSTAYLLANILGKAGYKTGFASSPHLQRINERMQIDMRKISNENLVILVNELIPAIEALKKLPEGEPSYFELLTALSFMHFAKEEVDIAVIEVGLEGKYDATNVLDPLVVILTNISKDHTDMLGSTELEIAQEAFSIVRKNDGGKIPAIITGVAQEELLEILRGRANSLNTQIKKLGRDFSYTVHELLNNGVRFNYIEGEIQYEDLEVRLRGEYQAANSSLAIATSRFLCKLGFSISEQHIREGLSSAFFPGRFEVIRSGKQIIILDGAHNEAKMKAFLHALYEYYPDEEKVLIVGFKRNKDTETMIRELFELLNTEFIFTEFNKTGDYARSNSMNLAELRSHVEKIDSKKKIKYVESVSEAFVLAQESGKELIVITGSLYLIGEIREYLFPTE